MQYQSFPGTKGGSRSLDKLIKLRLPPMEGKRFLDIGCNEGFFCGYAHFDGAEDVVGIDRSVNAIKKAKLRFPECVFYDQSWDVLPEGKFDVITFLSAIHYADDQEALIHRLMHKLTDDGVLVLELGIAPGHVDEWAKVERSIDTRYFPTREKLNTVLRDYAWKVIGHSVMQSGDPLKRYVLHIRKTRRYAFLLLDEPGSGKSTMSRFLFGKASIPVISGDRTYQQIYNGTLPVSADFKAVVDKHFDTRRLNKLIDHLIRNNHIEELVDIWIKRGEQSDFAIDSYVPKEHRQQIREKLSDLGYFPVDMGSKIDQSLKAPESKPAKAKAKAYQTYLGQQKSLSVELSQSIKVTHTLPSHLQKSVYWHLDSPNDGEIYSSDNPSSVTGWLLTKDESLLPSEMYVIADSTLHTVPLSQSRPQALIRVFGEKDNIPAFWQQNPCGFRLQLEQPSTKLEIGMIVDSKRICLAKTSIRGDSTLENAREVLGKIKRGAARFVKPSRS